MAAVLAASVAGLAGCGGEPRSYDGALVPAHSRLTVENHTPWPCRVTVEPAGAGQATAMTRISAALLARRPDEPAERFTWDLLAGRYRLSVERPDRGAEGFVTSYEAKAGKHLRWPLLNALWKRP